MLDEQKDESLGVEQLPQAELEASPGSNSVQADSDTDANDPNAHQAAPAMTSDPESPGQANVEEESKP
ncbi:MAG: hypothetical protein KME12_06270 [Trichocoleus desertorum ATA4-8-CV12]|jgi:hypothetical protein|nr:hypothetical protein [Trichocoleus desertorum ATA4-8-CV12]